MKKVKMSKFIVHVKEVWDQPVEVEAESKEHAISRVVEGIAECKESECSYSYTLDSDEWTIEKVN